MRLSSGVHLQNGQSLLEFGERNHDLAIEASGTQQSRIEDVGRLVAAMMTIPSEVSKPSISASILVEGLFSFVVATAEAGTAFATDGVDFVDGR